MAQLHSPILLTILDGWGIGRCDDPSNAIMQAGTPNISRLMEQFPCTALKCSGEAVGLPDGQMGNSEVGHLNIGGGRIVLQELDRIGNAIADGSLARTRSSCAAICGGDKLITWCPCVPAAS